MSRIDYAASIEFLTELLIIRKAISNTRLSFHSSYAMKFVRSKTSSKDQFERVCSLQIDLSF